MTDDEEIKKFTQGFSYKPDEPDYREVYEKRSEVCFTYYLPDHKSEVFIHTNAQKIYSLLWEIDQKCRAKLKYGEMEQWPQFVQSIRDLIHSEIDLDEGNQ